jgi:hypothetical protein
MSSYEANYHELYPPVCMHVCMYVCMYSCVYAWVTKWSSELLQSRISRLQSAQTHIQHITHTEQGEKRQTERERETNTVHTHTHITHTHIYIHTTSPVIGFVCSLNWLTNSSDLAAHTRTAPSSPPVNMNCGVVAMHYCVLCTCMSVCVFASPPVNMNCGVVAMHWCTYVHVWVSVRTCMSECMCVCVCIAPSEYELWSRSYALMHVCTCMSVCVCVCAHACPHIHIASSEHRPWRRSYALMYLCMCVCMYVCMYVCMCADARSQWMCVSVLCVCVCRLAWDTVFFNAWPFTHTFIRTHMCVFVT